MIDPKCILCAAAVYIAAPAHAAEPPAAVPCTVLKQTETPDGQGSVLALQVQCPGVAATTVTITRDHRRSDGRQGERQDPRRPRLASR